MNQKNVNILQCKFGLKIISAKYYDNAYGQNRSAEEKDYPHPDLIEARDALVPDLARAYYIEGEERDHFTVTGFVIEEGDGITTVDIHGQMTNSHEYVTNVKSGKIPLDEDQKLLKANLQVLKTELFLFLFESKTSQGKLDGFPANAAQEKDQGKDEIPVDDPKHKDNFKEGSEPPVIEPSVN